MKRGGERERREAVARDARGIRPNQASAAQPEGKPPAVPLALAKEGAKGWAGGPDRAGAALSGHAARVARVALR